jgi:hypothetical protein
MALATCAFIHACVHVQSFDHVTHKRTMSCTGGLLEAKEASCKQLKTSACMNNGSCNMCPSMCTCAIIQACGSQSTRSCTGGLLEAKEASCKQMKTSACMNNGSCNMCLYTCMCTCAIIRPCDSQRTMSCTGGLLEAKEASCKQLKTSACMNNGSCSMCLYTCMCTCEITKHVEPYCRSALATLLSSAQMQMILLGFWS